MPELPPIILFALTPLWGGRGQPHWPMPGWFFAFPLLGVWVEQLGASVVALRRWALVSSALLAAIAGVAGRASLDWLAIGEFDRTVGFCRSDAGGVRMARPDQSADL